jgi:uncharacterized protein (TIGR00255 family)
MKSMTGYGASQKAARAYAVSALVRSVNSRYLEINIHLPAALSSYEKEVRELISACAERGKVDVSFEVKAQQNACAIHVNRDLAKAYIAAHSELAGMLSTDTHLDPAALMRIEGVCTIEKQDDMGALWQDMRSCLENALKAFARTRAHDGEAARRDLEKLLRVLELKAKRIRRHSKLLVPQYAKDLERRLEAIAGKTVDQHLILSEAAIIASRSDINEELQRLESHIALFREHTRGDAACGRTLDFIAQEMHREINTIGSKQAESLISSEVIAMKAALEKIREQVRNVE